MSNGSPTPMYDFLREIQEEFNGFMIGELLGSGKHRAVYAHPHNVNWVIKVERPSDYAEFCNAVEWNVWTRLADSEAGKWLAPCVKISRQGSIMIQTRCEVCPEDQLPKKVPAWMTDAHQGNWGMIDGRPVLFDYGFLYNMLTPIAEAKSFKMIKRSKA
jgi:hypothetical protein